MEGIVSEVDFACDGCEQEYLNFEEVESHEVWNSVGSGQVSRRLFGFDQLRSVLTPMRPEPMKDVSYTASSSDFSAAEIYHELYPIRMSEALHRQARHQSNESIGVVNGEPVAFDLETEIDPPEPDAILCDYCYFAIFGEDEP